MSDEKVFERVKVGINPAGYVEIVADGWYCRGCKRNVDVPVKEGQEAKCPYCGTVHRRATA